MTILESCRESDQVTIKYQLWNPAGILLTFPTDGTEDEQSSGGVFTERFIVGGNGYSIHRNLQKSSVYIWFSCISQSNYWNGSDEQLICGERVYLRARGATSFDYDNATISIIDDVWRLTDASGNVYYNPLLDLVKLSVFSERKTLEEIDDRLIRGTVKVRLEEYRNGVFNYPSNSNCGQFGDGTNNVLRGEAGTIRFEGYTFHEEYFDTIVRRTNRSDVTIATRTTVPTSAETKEPELLPEEEYIADKRTETEDIEVETGANFLKIYKLDIYRNTRTKIKTLSSTPYSELPIWSYTCGGICPEGTCQVDWGTHYGCHDSNGIVVDCFAKNS